MRGTSCNQIQNLPGCDDTWGDSSHFPFVSSFFFELPQCSNLCAFALINQPWAIQTQDSKCQKRHVAHEVSGAHLCWKRVGDFLQKKKKQPKNTTYLQETPVYSIPKGGETASPSLCSLCGASVSAGQWFQHLQRVCYTCSLWTNCQLTENPQINKGRHLPSASVLFFLVVLFADSQTLGRWKEGVKQHTRNSTFTESCQVKSEAYLVFPAGSTYVVFSSFTHLPAAMTCQAELTHQEKSIKY